MLEQRGNRKRRRLILAFIILSTVLLVACSGNSGTAPAAHPAGTITEFHLPTGVSPQGISAGPDGNLWFTNGSSGQIGKFNPTTDQFTEYNLPNSGSLPDDIVSDGSGGLWFTEYEGFNVGHITLSGKIKEYSAPYPSGITRGPGSDFWFVGQQTDFIGKITSR